MTIADSRAQRLQRKQRLGVVVVLVACLIATGIMLSGDTTDIRFGIAAGVLGSLIASFMGLCFSLYVLDETPGDTARAADRLSASLDVLRRVASVAEHSARHSIDAVKSKSDYSSDEWIEVLAGAQEKLLLVGHALDTWCAEDFLSEFAETLTRLARDGKPVQLLTLPVEGANTRTLAKQRGQDYGQRVRATLGHVAAVHAALPPSDRRHLDVRTLAPDIPMPYMVVANEHVLITCAYPATLKSSNDMLATRMSATSEAGRAIREDIRHLLIDHAAPVDLDAVAPSAG